MTVRNAYFYFFYEVVEVDAEVSLLKKSGDKEFIHPKFITTPMGLHLKTKALIRAALQVASHTDLLVTMAHMELLKEVHSMLVY